MAAAIADGAPLAKFDEGKVKRDEDGKFTNKMMDVGAGAGGGAAISQSAAWIGDRLARLRARRLGLPEPAAGGMRWKQHLGAAAVGAVLGSMRNKGEPVDSAAQTLRTVGNISLGAAVGELAGLGAQVGLASATRGRVHAAWLPTAGAALGGGGTTLAYALDLTSRRRQSAPAIGT